MLKGRSLRACAALVGFCFSLLLVSIRPVSVSADDTSDYLLGTWYWAFGQSRNDWPNFGSIYQPNTTMTAYGVNAMPFNGKNLGGGDSLTDYVVGSMVSKRFMYGAPHNYYPDIVLSAGFSNPQVSDKKLHMLVKFGAGYNINSISKLDAPIHGFWFVGSQPYYDDTYAKATFIGSSAWPSAIDLTYQTPGSSSATNIFADYTSGYCYRVDFDAPGRYPAGSYAITGLGLWCENWCSPFKSVAGSLDAMGLIVGYLVCWADTGVAAIDDAITDILTHVAKIDGNVQNIYSTLKSLLAVAKEIGIDTDTMVKLLTSINSNVALLQSDVSGIYELLKTALADESAELDKKTEQAAESIMQRTDSEQYWSDKNQDNFNALNIDNFSFGDGVVSALGTVGGLFSGLWDALGDGVIVYTFPLMLGVALVLVGRLARSSGKGKGDKSAGGDDK